MTKVQGERVLNVLTVESIRLLSNKNVSNRVAIFLFEIVSYCLESVHLSDYHEIKKISDDKIGHRSCMSFHRQVNL